MADDHAAPAACTRRPIVLVDDEDSFRLALAELLRDDGHPVLAFESARSVPDFETLPRDAMLITDFEMPGPNGLELADAYHAARPAAPILLLSAYDLSTIDQPAHPRAWLRFGSKPIEYDALHQLVDDVA